ncbi:hypothetical protein NFI96_015774, partial [Prochilodus magdalenae]
GPLKINLPCVDGVKFIKNGENVTLNCPFETFNAITAWYKQTPGERLLLIASAFRSAPVTYQNGFEKRGRFTTLGEQSSFTLTISNAEPSDSATYYCAVADYADTVLSECTVLVLKDLPARLYTVLQHPVSDPVELGGDTTLQCSVLTDTSAGEHSVYWFRHGSGESHPGIIYTHGNRSDQCKSSSETDSSTQSCVYKLPKRNLSLSDAGTYYCAVLMCGEIIFGNGTKLDFVGKIIYLYQAKIKSKGENADALNYAALSFAQSSSSRRSRTKHSSDQPVYSQIHIRSPSRLYNVLQHPVSDPVELGGDTTLQCSVLTDTSAGEHSVYWFRHGSGESHPGIIYTHGNRSDQCKSSSETDSSTQSCVYKLPKRNLSLSDAGTYYCAVLMCGDIILGNGTKLNFVDSPSRLYTVLQHPVSGPVKLGGDTTLQCSVLTDTSAGEHSVYWFRHGSGESHPGIIYTHGNRSDQCKSSSETDSSTQSCVYKLPKRNLSLSDAGTYYCAVLMCGEIIFGSGTKLDFVGKIEYLWNRVLDPAILGLVASNFIFIIVVLLLCRKLHYSHHKDVAEGYTASVNQAEDADALNYAALSFAQSSSSRRSRTKNSSDQPVYSQEKHYLILGIPTRVDLPCADGMKFIQNGENVTLNCPFRTFNTITTIWLKQTPGEKLLIIASAYRSVPVKYHNGFEKSRRFTALEGESSFTLTISNAEPSDSATYYCAAADFSDTILLECTVLVLKDSPSRLYTVLQHPVSGPVELGGDTTLQCSVLTDTSAGEHSVYWFRHGSGKSHPGIIYTHGNRSDQCKSSSETDSSTQSCVYKLPKRNLSLSDAGTYYCAVLMCGEIIFGRGTKLDFVGKIEYICHAKIRYLLLSASQ